ncbi:MAG: cation:proton antiporter [Gammaproteobacteria bacterium]|jgi:Kef-type K+ transport system membrane component KefB|nr:cation:proton antiporter [Gammaproteobacteria bacterium]
MNFLSNFSTHISPLAFFGLILLLGLIGGEITRLIRFIPKISGYIAVGFIVGPGLFNIVNYSEIVDIKIFVDISLGLILFNLGRQLDFQWLRHDRNLFFMSLAESGLTFIFVFSAFLLLGFSTLSSSFAATIAMTTSPAVIMLIVNDLSSEGPITRRTLMLTSLNNFWGLIIFTLLLPIANPKIHGIASIFENYGFKVFGSVFLAFSIFLISIFIGKIIGKKKQNQIILFVSIVLLTISLANSLNFSIKLSLFVFGVIVRNFDRKHTLIEVDFEWGIRLAFILLFVVTGMQIYLQGLAKTTLAVIVFLFVRSLAKSLGIWLFAKRSRLTTKQTVAISLALTPMAGVTFGMLSTLTDFNQDLGKQLTMIVVSVVAILHILGPIATQYAFIKSDETSSTKN